ncbi:MAG: alpha/beta fold hydrolase [Legionellaceae bacterium]
MKKQGLYAIPGWGFNSQIFESFIPARGLDYITQHDLNITTIALNLGRTIQSNAVLMAWSLGGLIAIKMAALYPEKIIGLVLMASQPQWISDGANSGLSLLDAEHFILRAQQNFDELFNHFLKLSCYPSHARQQKNKLIHHAIADHPTELISFLTKALSLDLTEDYASIDCPLLHLCGSNDAVINQKDYVFSHHARVKHIQGAGHAGFMTHKGIYLEHIYGFLNDLPSLKK